MNLKVGDILVTQSSTKELWYAVITKENKVSYTVTFLNSGNTDTVNKISLTSYGPPYYGMPHHKYLPYKGKLEPDVISLLKERETLSSELKTCKEELFAAKCILNRMISGPEACTNMEHKVLEDIKQNPIEYETWCDDDCDNEPCEEPNDTYGDSLEAQETDNWVMPK